MTDNNDTPNTPENSLTPEEARKAYEELQHYRAALEQEFADAAAKAETTDEVIESTINFFKKGMADTAAQVMFLSQNSTSDGVRLNACKYMIDCVRKGVADSHTDPVNEILNKIFKANDAKEADTSDLVQEERPGEH